MTAAPGTHDEHLAPAAALAYTLLRFETGVDSYSFFPVARKVEPEIMVSYLASAPSPVLLVPSARVGIVVLMFVAELDEDRRKWAQHSIDNSLSGLAAIAKSMELDDRSTLLLEFNGESHVFSLETLRQCMAWFHVLVGWTITRLDDDPRSSARLLLIGSNNKQSDGWACAIRPRDGRLPG